MPTASIIVPAFNSEKTLSETVTSLLSQSFRDLEIIIVNDGSTDNTLNVARTFLSDPRVRLVKQANRGLAGARNTGIDAAQGRYIGFCDADDIWFPQKLETHIRHLDSAPDVGLSFSGSTLIDDASNPTGVYQRPRLRHIGKHHVLCRNPVGNGSAAVMRREALEDLAWRPRFESKRDWVFDERFRQSEDIECWMRLVLTTDWQIEGVPGLLVGYRVTQGGLSADTERQFAAWERMIRKLRPVHPAFFKKHEAAARAYQLRYLARRAISASEASAAWPLVCRALDQSLHPLLHEPRKTGTTVAAAAVLALFGPRPVLLARQIIANRSPQA